MTGVALVAVATAIGGWTAMAADDGERYWVVREEVRAGDPVEVAQLATTSARLDGAAAATVVRADVAVDESAVWAHDLPEGAFVSASSWAPSAEAGHELPFPVADGAFPADLGRGDRVDIWAGPGPQQGQAAGEAQRLIAAVPVRAVTPSATGGMTTVVVDLGDQVPSAQVVAALSSHHVTVVRRS
ncbi:hypothetical protein BHE97_01140 [Aeromicrobium sp. PE09-221]|nr:hypothetical protein BHE97_01140 [Aeromicrobium sp. PE09-221]